MLPNLDYPTDNDGYVFHQSTLELGSKPIHISACTVQGSKDGIVKKPNEDAYSVVVDKNIFVAVFDGCSSQKPIEWLTDQTGARFASHFVKSRFEHIVSNLQSNQLLQTLNTSLGNESLAHQNSNTEDVHSLPATTATIAKLDLEHNELSISHIGDTFCILYYENGTSEQLTVDKNEKYDQQIFQKIKEIAETNSITPRLARQDPAINEAIKEMFQKTYNTSDGDGQGILNGDLVAEKYIQKSTFTLNGVQAVLMGSDGLVPPNIDEHTVNGRSQLKEILDNGGLKLLFKTKQQIEDSDPDWHFIRYKHSDDATGIYVEL